MTVLSIKIIISVDILLHNRSTFIPTPRLGKREHIYQNLYFKHLIRAVHMVGVLCMCTWKRRGG